MNHFREIERNRSENLFTFMPHELISEANRDKRLYVRVPRTHYYHPLEVNKPKPQSEKPAPLPIPDLDLQNDDTLPKQKSQSSVLLHKWHFDPNSKSPTHRAVRAKSIDSFSGKAFFKQLKATRAFKKSSSVLCVVTQNDKKHSLVKNFSERVMGRKPSKKARKYFKGCDDPIACIYQEGCLTCGRENIEVKYFQQRHMCLKCREYLRSPDGKPALVFLLTNGKILAVSKKVDLTDPSKIKYDKIDHTDLRFFDREAYATFAREDEMIVLLKHKE